MGKNIPEELKFAIFDLDGTLYSQFPVHLQMAWRLSIFYITHPNKWRQLYGIYLFRKIREQKQNQNLSINAQIKLAADKAEITATALSENIRKWMFQVPLQFLKRYKRSYVISFLESLQKADTKIVIYSDYPVEEKLEVLGIKADYFFYPGVNQIDSLKPSPQAMKTILTVLNTDAMHCVLIGDRDEKDGESARLVGMKFIHENTLKKGFKYEKYTGLLKNNEA